jgi:transketolase
MAMAAKQLKAKMENDELFNQKIYVILGDGCQMEGSTSEAASLAGHLKLNNLIAFYDDNDITIEGSTALAFSEDVEKRYESYGWTVIKIDGHNESQIESALEFANASTDKPVLIIGHTIIGKGSPNKAGKASSHGAPLGVEEVALVKEGLGFPTDQFFNIPEDVKQLCSATAAQKVQDAEAYQQKLEEFFSKNPEKKELYQQLFNQQIPENIVQELLSVVTDDKAVATRVSSGECIQKISALVPAFAGGSADLAPSCKSDVTAETSFSSENYLGRNFHYGVREFAMGLAANGQALYGSILPYTSTFFVFCDYMKPAIRLAALQDLKQVYVFTHDSFYVGEDGPTHQPIEHISMLRAIPNLTVIRPADARETAHAWATALKVSGPVALLLTRQNVGQVTADIEDQIALEKGAYVVSDEAGFDVTLIGTGSEVEVALNAAKILRENGKAVRVVSMPSWELFDQQSVEYKQSVLCPTNPKIVSIESASTFGWAKYTGLAGLNIGLDHFGVSAPGDVLAEKFGINAKDVAAKVLAYLED